MGAIRGGLIPLVVVRIILPGGEKEGSSGFPGCDNVVGLTLEVFLSCFINLSGISLHLFNCHFVVGSDFLLYTNTCPYF